MNTYNFGTAVDLTCYFTALGEAANPTTLTLTITPPSGVPIVLNAGDVEHPEIGTYTYTYLPAAVGSYSYVWIGNGAVQAGSGTKAFAVVA